jgi:hypothetical protein
MRRKKIRDRTKLCSALLALGRIPYPDAKLMTEDQFLSLWHFDHNILHEAQHPDGDKYWNLTPMLIRAHREKTKLDAKIIAKSRRIRAWNEPFMNAAVRAPKLRTGPDESKRHAGHGAHAPAAPRPARTLRSRGFDKTLRKKMDGTVVKRTGG